MLTLTHRIDPRLKKMLDRFCEKHGLKQQAVISEAIASWLEDAKDIELIEERREGPWVDWDDVNNEI